MIDGLISGRIYGTPAEKAGQNGKPYVVAKVRAATAGDDALFVSVITFSDSVGSALLALNDGDSVCLSGELKPRAWVDRAGDAHPSLDMTAHAVLTAYHVQRKRTAMNKNTPPGQDELVDDDL